jgi:hypothetical protein
MDDSVGARAILDALVPRHGVGMLERLARQRRPSSDLAAEVAAARRRAGAADRQAAAYDLVPNRLGLVNAAAQVFVVFELLLPLAVGVIAARAGTAAALASLVVQPVFVIVVALAVLRRPASPPPAAPPAASR